MRSAAWLPLLFSTFIVTAIAQSGVTSTTVSSTNPETGFMSKTRYTNAFFGFSLRLPHDTTFTDYGTSSKGKDSGHFLLGLQTITIAPIGPLRPKLTLFVVTAKKSTDPDDLRNAAAGPKRATPTRMEIAGKEFWTSEVEEKVPEGTEHHVAFSTEAQGYILQFNIESFDKKLAAKLRDSVSHIEFFDPATAQIVAGSDSKPYPSSSGSLPQK
jgi:hypothetical protein